MANKKFVPIEAPTQAEKKKASARPKNRPGLLNRLFGLVKKKKNDTVEMDLISSDDTGTEDKATQPARIAFLIEKNMENFLQELTLGGLKRLKSEWSEVSCHVPSNMQATLYDYNMAKNFPGSYPCLDATRVGLTFNVPPDQEYIHANWVQTKLCNLGLRLILTQAPQEETVNDFYRLIYQEKVLSVVMLCQKYEQNRRVCSQYWPLVVGTAKVYGPLRVYYVGNVTPSKESAFVKHHLNVSYRSEKAHDCYIYVAKLWPEGGAPETRAMLRMLRAVVDDGQTVMVHGGAGVGRSGTFASIMIARKMLLEGTSLTGPMNIPTIVREIREQRMGSVNTELLYISIYRAICDYIRAKGVNVQLCKQLINHLDAYKKEYIAAGNQPVDVKSGPFEIKGGPKQSAEARTLPSPTQPSQNPLTPTNLASTPMTNNAQPETKGDDQYVVLNAINALPPPPK